MPTTDGNRPAQQRRDPDWDRLLKITWTVIGLVLITLGALWLLGRLWTVLLPLFLGLIIVFFLRPPVEWMVRRNVPRLAAVSICYVTAVAVIVVAGVLLAPAIVRQTAEFTSALPEYAERLEGASERMSARYQEMFPPWLSDGIGDAMDGAASEVGGIASIVAAQLMAIGNRVVGIVTGLVTGIVIGFYLLYSLPAVGPGVVEAMPPGWRRDAREAGARIETAVGGFIRGQVILMVVVGVLTWIAMLIIGMPYPGFIGALAGILDFVPYVGPFGAALVAVVIGLLTDPILALWALIAIVIVQQIETNLVRPKVMGDTMGVHPVVVILTVIGATTLFGFIGLILSVPTLAVVKTLYAFYAEKQGWTPW